METKISIPLVVLALLTTFTLGALAQDEVFLPLISSNSSDGGSALIPNPTATQADPTPTVAPTTTDATTVRSQVWLTSWMMNETSATSSVFDNVEVNVTAVSTRTINGNLYQCITASGIPNYETVVTQSLIDSLNSRPRAALEFGTGQTSLTLGQSVAFGENIGYDLSLIHI